jgi:hypothetical protein
MGKSRIADSIMREYERKKRYEAKIQRQELEKFMKENCLKCKNSNTKLCHIVKNVDNKFSCPFKNI